MHFAICVYGPTEFAAVQIDKNRNYNTHKKYKIFDVSLQWKYAICSMAYADEAQVKSHSLFFQEIISILFQKNLS